MNRGVNKKSGFTIIELMLAMAFVSTLLIAVALTVIQIGNTYNRGITLKNVNQVGRSIANELQRSIAGSEEFDIDSGVGSRYIVQDWGGRLCLGQYSYVWNYGNAIQVGDTARLNTYVDSPDTIRFAKVLDQDSSYCDDSSKKIELNDAIELVDAGENDLAIHDFLISTTDSAGDSKTGQRLYSIEFKIGTNTIDTLNYVSDNNPTCKLSGESGADPSYCSINMFNIVVRAGNTVE